MNTLKTSIMPVTGLSCTNCAQTIGSHVSKMAGVKNADVDFASEKMTLSYDPAQVSEIEIIALVSRIGYGVATGKLSLPVTGMQDQTDALTLEKVILQQAGVIKASASYGTEQVQIEHSRYDQCC
jgi:Cu+-exporting ATPase